MYEKSYARVCYCSGQFEWRVCVGCMLNKCVCGVVCAVLMKKYVHLTNSFGSLDSKLRDTDIVEWCCCCWCCRMLILHVVKCNSVSVVFSNALAELWTHTYIHEHTLFQADTRRFFIVWCTVCKTYGIYKQKKACVYSPIPNSCARRIYVRLCALEHNSNKILIHRVLIMEN